MFLLMVLFGGSFAGV
ncbi:MAG TPA: hypothetical protein ENL15_03425 [Firmicutes bacterium]|nr:hypothetical protein [Bacillota bacterium]